MRYYVYSPDPDVYAAFMAGSLKKDRLVRFFDATPVAASWVPVTLESMREDAAPPGEPTDFPFLSGPTPLFGERAWAALRPLVERDVEALPVTGPDGRPYYAIHVLRILPCVFDAARSEHTTNAVTGRVSWVHKHAIHSEAVPSDANMFKMEETRGLEVLVSERFRAAVEEAGLVGLDYRPVEGTTE